MAAGNLQILDVGPTRQARAHLRLIRIAAAAEQATRRRGMGRVVSVLGRVFGSENYLVAAVDEGLMKVSLNDAYWMTPLMRTGTYEPEVDAVLKRTLRSDSAFVDCGANIGYWSVRACQLIAVPRSVVALEANPAIAARLVENARINGDCFAAVQAAVWSTTGDVVEVAVDSVRHSWSSADPQVAMMLKELGFTTAHVQTITIDDALERFVRPQPKLVVVKIDIEGAEEQALKGAPKVLERDALLIYEEHRRSDERRVTELLLNQLGMHVFDISSREAPTRVQEVDQTSDRVGPRAERYNLCAAWPETEAYHRLLSVGETEHPMAHG